MKNWGYVTWKELEFKIYKLKKNVFPGQVAILVGLTVRMKELDKRCKMGMGMRGVSVPRKKVKKKKEEQE